LGIEPSKGVVRFDGFELDVRTAELRSPEGRTVRLSEQPLRILTALLEHPGDLVLREDLRKRLWPNDTVVEFEHSINAAVNRLRQVLGDSADNPKFIETLARRGYRWKTQVQWVTQVAVPAPPEPRDGNLIGKRISHYRVLEVLGGGGMGVVYKAEDIKLGRRVALKFLPEELAGDTAALQRFEREARAASALNHSNICTIHAVEEHEGQPFLVMELLEGQTLREIIENKSGSTADVQLQPLLDIAIQVASGLEAAHQKGIIHRDIKPANIFLTTHGQVKILDFGLAKVGMIGDPGDFLKMDVNDSHPTSSQQVPSIDDALSRAGTAMGTAAYMSPEQVRGEKLDARTDLFSFGLILYEMATGRRAFGGDSVTTLHNAILNSIPIPAHQVNPKLVPKLEEIIEMALKKDRDERYQSALEMRLVLEACVRTNAVTESSALSKPQTGGQVEGTRQAVEVGWRFLRWLLPGVALAGATAVAVWYVLRPVPPPRITDFQRITFDGAPKTLLGIDGSRLYFHVFQETGIRQMAVPSGVSEPIPIDLPNVQLLGISPDRSSMLVGLAPRDNEPEVPISIVRTAGGAVRHLADGVSAAWSPDGGSVIYSTADGNINLIRRDGTGNHRLASISTGTVVDLRWSPDGTTIRFRLNNRLWQMSSKGVAPHEVLDDWPSSEFLCCGWWTPDGKLFVFQGTETKNDDQTNQIWALDERRRLFRRPRAEIVELTSGPIQWWTTPVPSEDGKKIFAIGGNNRMELVRFDSKLQRLEPYLAGISAQFVNFSKDGKSIAFVSVRDFTLWKANRDGGNPVQLCGPSVTAVQPRWSPDGSQILFTSVLNDHHAAYVVSSSGGSAQPLLPEDAGGQDDPDWSPDGRKIVLARNGRDGHPSIIQILDVASHKITKLAGSDGFHFPRWSPDGRLIVAQADDNLSLKTFDLATQKKSTFQISKPTSFPVWSRDGRFIYVEIYEGKPGVFRIPVKGGEPQLVVDLKDIRQIIGDGGKWLELDPTDAPLLLRDGSTDDIYALTLEQ
jgi:serine/threonine protein kinase/Tol biopolymer transport system component/DNA-binding winged helix-turn-helix (wHTH) protein